MARILNMANVCDNIWLNLRLAAIILGLVPCFLAQADGTQADGGSYQIIELKADTLPSLNIARSGHTTLFIDDELTVLGGHTNGFVPTATAEYLRDGVWHTVPLVYPHDHGSAIWLNSGKVFLAGGHKEDLGIGQIFAAELYDPSTHTSQGFGCMDEKRAYANAIELADGQVLISGNWYADDGIEMFSNVNDLKNTNAVKVKDTSFARATPYILKISDDDAIIFGSLDNKGEPADYGIVDRLKGPAYREPFLEAWHPIHTINVRRSTNHFIGDEAEGRYEWLLPVENDETRQVAIARVKGTADNDSIAAFSLLPTQQPLPDSIHGKPIIYSSLICDRERGVAYLIGDDDEARVFVVSFRYDTPSPSPLTIYMTDPQPLLVQDNTPVLTPEGDLIFTGGHLISNFSPLDTVIRLPLVQANASADTDASAAHAGTTGHDWWLWIIVSCLIAGAVVALLLVKRKKSKQACETGPKGAAEESETDKEMPKEEILADLFNQIEQLMDVSQLYLNANLRASDVAERIGTNSAYVSAAINLQRGCSFTQYVVSYRIAYAQKLMLQDPERKISAISALSGFSTDSTFFRAFRLSTGMSPKEWLSANQEANQS